MFPKVFAAPVVHAAPPVEEEELNPKDLTNDSNQRNFLAAMFQFHREADDETRKTMKGRRMSSWAATKNMGTAGNRKTVY